MTELKKSAIEEVSRVVAGLGWQPLVDGYWTGEPNANKLGEKVLLFKDGVVYSARWVDSDVMGPVWATPDGHVIFRATHWMPQPEPPQSSVA